MKYIIYGNVNNKTILELIKSRKLRIGISGSRRYYGQKFAEVIKDTIAKLLKEKNIEKHEVLLISGGAKGIDTEAERVAEEMGIDILVIRPDYKSHPPKIAPLERNEVIAELSDILIAIPAPESRGTRYTIKVFRNKKPENQIIVINVISSDDTRKNTETEKKLNCLGFMVVPGESGFEGCSRIHSGLFKG